MKSLYTGVTAPIKNCPFCDRQVFAKVNVKSNVDSYFFEAEIKCPECNIAITTDSPYFYSSNGLLFNDIIMLMSKTVDKWNTRAKE